MATQVTSEQILSFIKQNWLRIICRGMISLAAVLFLVVIYYAAAPRRESYRSEVLITLQQKNGKPSYPNGEMFSAHDLISTPVLSEVWQRAGKPGKFENFAQWFTFVSYNKERAIVDAKYAGLLAKRNISATELANLQTQYEEELRALDDHRYMLSMRPDALINKADAIKIMADIPQVWYEQYSLLNAKTIPQLMSQTDFEQLIKGMNECNACGVEYVDAISRYIKELKFTCQYLRESLLQGRNLIIGNEELGSFESQIKNFESDVLRLKMALSRDNSESLRNYIQARMFELDCDKLAAEEQVNAVKSTLDMLAGTGQTAMNGGSEGTQVQADATFFKDFAAMVRQNANSTLVATYAKELTDLRKELAQIQSQQLYYKQLLDTTTTTTTTTIGEMAKRLVDAVAVAGGKLTNFRDQALREYRLQSQFYVVTDNPAYGKTFTFSLVRFAALLLAIWALYNLIGLVKLWNEK